ncbi:S-layer homology domain-containing protein [Brevibacillus panacihumi]|uniref:S-layer homology domain-containing protein n=1 Tax=Brevibacillus panacihumi TaxID=497735 RepID=UPI003CFBE8B6
MNPFSKKLATLLLATAVSAGTLPFAALNAQAASPLTSQEIQQAVNELTQLRVLQGYPDHSMGVHQPVTRAELAKMVVPTFGLERKTNQLPSFDDVKKDAWYYDFVTSAVGQNIIQADKGRFDPEGTVTARELEQIIAKALKRDLKSVQYWMERVSATNGPLSRGEVAYLLNTAYQAIPSATATITDIRPLNTITLIITFDAPLTAEDEAFAVSKEQFAFSDGLALTNMPRLKTGSVSTYIVPTSPQKPGTIYTLTYKGKQAGTFAGQGTKLNMTEARQVTNDTFELEALKSAGVTDYGYVISAYSAGRGANAFVLDENDAADGKTYQIISSMQARQVTITPEGGQPIVANYVPFTQSTDGKQEPKFRLPEGQTLEPGVRYTVTSEWAEIANPNFVAEEIAPLQLSQAEAVSDTSITVTLSSDPGDELFSGRRVELTSPAGEKLVATYKYSSRKGATGVFDLQQNDTLKAGTTYTVTPVGDWAGNSQVELAVQ